MPAGSLRPNAFMILSTEPDALRTSRPHPGRFDRELCQRRHGRRLAANAPLGMCGLPRFRDVRDVPAGAAPRRRRYNLARRGASGSRHKVAAFDGQFLIARQWRLNVAMPCYGGSRMTAAPSSLFSPCSDEGARRPVGATRKAMPPPGFQYVHWNARQTEGGLCQGSLAHGKNDRLTIAALPG